MCRLCVVFPSMLYFLCFARHLERASHRECARARGEGAGPRGVSAARDEKLVPDIYLTIPGSSDAPRPEVSTADSLRNMIRL